MNTIELNNNFYLEIGCNQLFDQKNIQDIRKIKLNKIHKHNLFLLKIDFNTFSEHEYKKFLKNLLHVKLLLSIKKQPIGYLINSKRLLGYVMNYDKNKKQHNDFILAVNAIFYNNKYERYNYIYDVVCNYLDSCFYGKNLCDFKNNKCGEKINTSSVTGCCRHFQIKCLGPLTNLVTCEYLTKDYTCSAKCISCKLYTCDYLRKKGIKFKIKDILLLNVFFNPLQKYFIKYMVFTPKEKILRILMLL